MVRLHWAGIESLFLSTKVGYPKDGVSHFRMFSDNVRMTWLHIRLVTGMLLRIPQLAHRKNQPRKEATGRK